MEIKGVESKEDNIEMNKYCDKPNEGLSYSGIPLGFLLGFLIAVTGIIIGMILVETSTSNSSIKSNYGLVQDKQQENEMDRLCKINTLCMVGDELRSYNLLAFLSDKSSKSRYSYTLVVKAPTKEAVTEESYLPATKEAVTEESYLPATKESVTEESYLPTTKEAVTEESYLPTTKEAVIEGGYLPPTKELVFITPRQETLMDYCLYADQCLIKTNVSLEQVRADIKTIGSGSKSIRFYMSEIGESDK